MHIALQHPLWLQNWYSLLVITRFSSNKNITIFLVVAGTSLVFKYGRTQRKMPSRLVCGHGSHGTCLDCTLLGVQVTAGCTGLHSSHSRWRLETQSLLQQILTFFGRPLVKECYGENRESSSPSWIIRTHSYKYTTYHQSTVHTTWVTCSLEGLRSESGFVSDNILSFKTSLILRCHVIHFMLGITVQLLTTQL